MSKKQVLCLEYNIFCRILNHVEEFEEHSLQYALNNILEEIEKELNVIASEEFTSNRYYF